MTEATARCIDPAALSEDDIDRFVHGEAGEHVADHVERCPVCGDEARDYGALVRTITGQQLSVLAARAINTRGAGTSASGDHRGTSTPGTTACPGRSRGTAARDPAGARRPAAGVLRGPVVLVPGMRHPAHLGEVGPP